MTFADIVSLTITGLVRGGLYALMALGLSLVFGVLNVPSFAHGEFYAIGAYVAYFVFSASLSPVAAIVAATLVAFAAGVIVERVLFVPLRRMSGQDWLMNSYLITVGLSFVLKNAAQAVWGVRFQGITRFWEGSIQIMPGVTLGYDRAVAFVVAVGTMLGFWLLMQKTEFGRSVRAVSQNETGAMLVGIDLNRVYALTFGLSSSLAGLAGAVLLSILPAFPNMGTVPLNKSWFVVMLVGLGNTSGAMLVGLMVGILETLTYRFLGGGWQDVVSLAVVMLVLLFKPSGLFGSTTVKSRWER